MEHCCRSLVVAVQVMAGMWKKNGFSVVNQIIYYQYQNTREILYDKDVLMLQVSKFVSDASVRVWVSFCGVCTYVLWND